MPPSYLVGWDVSSCFLGLKIPSPVSAMADRRLHVVMLPWLAFGHMIPFLELSKALARRGHKISFLSTPRNIQRLPKIPPHLSPLIDLVQLPLPHSDEDLPEGAESTMDIPGDKVPYLKKAADGLEALVADFLRSASPPPDWIVHDFFHHWISSSAASGVPCVFFSVFSPWLSGYCGPPPALGEEDDSWSWASPEQWEASPKWIPFPTEMTFRHHEVAAMAAAAQPNVSGVADTYRLGAAIKGCSVFTLRASVDLAPEWLDLIRDLYQKPVVPVGFLPPIQQERSDGEGWEEIHRWLEKQKAGTVVYVAFGSEAEPSLELIQELAMGLELSELPFLWALKRPPGWPAGVELLPPAFEDRNRGRGLVTTNWVPQVSVLAHPSVGGFLTHSGWSSVIEGLVFGRPLVLLPLFADQCLIARAMGERKVGVEIPRDEKDGSFTRDGVARSLRLVMVSEEGGGEVVRANAAKASEIFADRSRQDRYVDDFIQVLVDRKSTPAN